MDVALLSDVQTPHGYTGGCQLAVVRAALRRLTLSALGGSRRCGCMAGLARGGGCRVGVGGDAVDGSEEGVHRVWRGEAQKMRKVGNRNAQFV